MVVQITVADWPAARLGPGLHCCLVHIGPGPGQVGYHAFRGIEPRLARIEQAVRIEVAGIEPADFDRGGNKVVRA